MNLQKLHFINLHQDIAQIPQDHISIDLLGPYNITSQGNSYALTIVCNLSSYLMTLSIKDKETMAVVTHLFSDTILKFGFSRILHSDDSTEFKSKLIEHLTTAWYKKTYIYPCHSQANRKLESSNRFIKDYSKLFIRQCHVIGPIAPLCKSQIQLVSK